jgi:hypothetical protein
MPPPLALPEAPGFIITDLSYLLAEHGLGLQVQTRPVPAEALDLESGLRLAASTGYLLVLDAARSNDVGAERARRLLEDHDYRATQSPITPARRFLYPAALGGDEPDYFLDGKLAEEIVDYLASWTVNEAEIHTVGEDVDRDLAAAADRAAALQVSQKNEAAARAAVESLRAQVTELERQAAELTRELESITPADLLALLASFQVAAYDPRTDFFARVLRDNLVSIAGKPYDGPQVTHKFLHPDLVAALDRLVTEGRPELERLGLWPLRLASAARTPSQQAGLTNPVAAGMFSSGHVYGAAFDFEVPPGLNTGATWDVLNRVLGRFGLLRKDALRTKDPNHVFLGSFVRDRAFANNLRLRMLGGYTKSMKDERERQRGMLSGLKKESDAARSAIARLDALLRDTAARIDALEREKATLKQSKASVEERIRQTKDAVRTQRARNESSRHGRSDSTAHVVDLS